MSSEFRLNLFLGVLFINMLSLDLVLPELIPINGIYIKLLILLLLFYVSKNSRFKESNYKIFFSTIIYIFLCLLIGFIFQKANITNEFFSSAFSLVIPAFLFTRYFRYKGKKSLYPILFAPIGVIALGFIYFLFFNRPIYRFEGDGIFRLQGASIPAHLGMICFFAIFVGNIFLYFSKRKKTFITIYILFLFILQYSTGSRTALLCSILTTAIFAFKFSNLSLITKVFLGSFGSLFAIVYLIIDNNRNVVSNSNDQIINTSGRAEAWMFFWQKFLENRYLGIGPGNSSKFVKASEIEFFITPHNEYLRILLESGIIIAILISIIVFFFLYERFYLNKSHRSVFGNFFKGLLYLNVFIYSVTDNTFATYQFYIPFLFLLNYVDMSEFRIYKMRKNTLINHHEGESSFYIY